MLGFFAKFLLLLSLTGCGVKALPIAPQQPAEPQQEIKINCSVYDPDCDKEDPNYVPQGKNGKTPQTEE